MKKNVTLGVILILIGIIWLLANLSILSFSIVDVFFRSLARLWPLLLIGFGLNILLKEKGILKLLIWLIIVVTIFLYGLSGIHSGPSEYEHLPQAYNYSQS